jgi:ATP-binding cassette, subfamily B, bacterial
MKLFWIIGPVAFAIALLVFPPCLHRFQAWCYGEEYLGSEGVRFQSKENDCGPASLAMVYDTYGVKVRSDEIERSVEMTHDGSTMLALDEQAAKDGLRASGWRLTMEELKITRFPAILFIRGNHFVVADCVSGDNVYLRDPALGRVRVSEKDLVRIWHGETLVFSKK